MTALIVLTAACFVGIGTVFWLLKNDDTSLPDNEREILSLRSDIASATQDNGTEADAPVDPKSTFSLQAALKKIMPSKPSTEPSGGSNDPTPKAPPVSPTGILAKLLGKSKPFQHFSEKNTDELQPLPSLKDSLEAEKRRGKGAVLDAAFGTASIQTVPIPTAQFHESNIISAQDEKKIEDGIILSTELNELKEKYVKLDHLFCEKSAAYEETKEKLNNELKNRKEFNKVKDILEKELKDTKDKIRTVQSELNSALAENTSLTKHTGQLEERIASLKNKLLEKDDKIGDLVKHLRVFESPSTETIPPKKETTTESEDDPPAADRIHQPPEADTVKEDRAGAEEPDLNSEGMPPVTPTEDSPLSPPQAILPIIDTETSADENSAKNNHLPSIDPVPEMLDIPVDRPTPYDPDNQPKEETSNDDTHDEMFLKLAPDVLSEELPKESLTSAEIEKSIQSPESLNPAKPAEDRDQESGAPAPGGSSASESVSLNENDNHTTKE